MISSNSIDGKSVELFYNIIDTSFNLQSNKKYWKKDLGSNLFLVRIVFFSNLYVVSNSVFDKFANGGVLNSFKFVPLIYSTSQASYIDVSWYSTAGIS